MAVQVAGELLADGFSGSCFCGAVRYASRGTPRFAYICHCIDCRRVSGTAFHTGIAVEADGFTTDAGSPAKHVTTADSGHEITRYHCAACGSSLWSTTTADASMVSVKAGSVTSHDADRIQPELQIWIDSRIDWLPLPEGLVSYRRGMRGEDPV